MKTIGLLLQIVGGFIFAAAFLFILVGFLVFDGIAGSQRVGLSGMITSGLPILLSSFGAFMLGKYLRDTK